MITEKNKSGVALKVDTETDGLVAVTANNVRVVVSYNASGLSVHVKRDGFMLTQSL